MWILFVPEAQTCLLDSRLCSLKMAALMKGEVNELTRRCGAVCSGHAVQCLLEFQTSGALLWLSTTGPASLLERTGLAQAVHQGRSLGSSKITNVTLGGKTRRQGSLAVKRALSSAAARLLHLFPFLSTGSG